MTKYYDYGIDLGTTNSCIATLDANGAKIFQNLDNMNVTPSAIYIGKNGRMLVGRRAYDKMIMEPENTAIEFKRLMGVKHTHKFKDANKEMTPVEMSAELLKAMREDVFRQKNIHINEAVITVPAAFGTIQCEDTYKAAELAGFKSVVLLQEPIAAAIAYGAKEGSKDQHWMVFDFGGGTLDIAIVSTFDARLTVMNHEGDNYLGGKNIDELIYRNIILPQISNKFILPKDASKMEYIHRKLLIFAEDAKKALSTTSTTTLDIFDVCEDEEGTPIECCIDLTRNDFDKIIDPIIEKCIELCNKAIQDSKIPGNKIDKVLMVGGTTLIPTVRNAIKDYFDAPLDTSIDPMTVVARGATIYGSTYKVPQEFLSENVSYDSVSVQLEFTPATSENTANIVGKFVSGSEALRYGQVKIDEQSGIWTSGWIEVLDEEQGIFDIDVTLQKNTINTFKLSLRDINGEIVSLDEDTFKIKHQDEVLITSAPPIPHSLCIEINSDGQRVLEQMIVKGTILPAKAIKKFKANKTIRPNTKDFIAIKIWEGENLKTPDNNQWVGNIYIRSESISRPIPEGFEIEVSVGIDESRKISVAAYIPHIELVITGDLVYNAEQLDLKTPMQLLENDIRIVYSIIDEIQDKAVIDEIIGKAEEYAMELHDIDLEYMECNKLIGLDDDRVIQLLKRFNAVRAKVQELEQRHIDSTREEDENDEIKKIEVAIEEFGDDNDKQEFKELSESYKKINANVGSRGKQHYKEKMKSLQARVLLNDPNVLKYFLIESCNPAKVYHDEQQALHWKQKGLIAIEKNDVKGMQEALMNLNKLSGQDTISTLSERELPPDLRG